MKKSARAKTGCQEADRKKVKNQIRRAVRYMLRKFAGVIEQRKQYEEDQTSAQVTRELQEV